MPSGSFRNAIETPFGNRRGQEKGKGWELQGVFQSLGERCTPALSKRHANTIWQQTFPGKGKVWKLERLRRQAWPGMWQKAGAAKMEAARVFQAQVKDAIRQFRNAIEHHLTTDVARKRAKGGSCRAVFQSRAKDAIRHFRSAMQTPFGNRCCQERAKCGSWRGLGDRHGKAGAAKTEAAGNRRGCQQTWPGPQPMSHTCGDPRRRPGYAILCYFLFFIL